MDSSAKLRELLSRNESGVPYVSPPEAVHRYQCPATRIGRTVHGPCDCGGDALQAEIDEAMREFLNLDAYGRRNAR
jgi:hypothetical protein